MSSTYNNVFLSTKIKGIGQSKSQDFLLAEFVKKELETKGFNVFLSEHHNMAGSVWKQTLEKQLKEANFFIFISSDHEHFIFSEPIRFELSTFFNLIKSNNINKKFYRLNSKSFSIKTLKSAFSDYKNSNDPLFQDLDTNLIDIIDSYDNISFEFTKNIKTSSNTLDINSSIINAVEKLIESLQLVNEPNNDKNDVNLDNKLKKITMKLKNHSDLLTKYKLDGLDDLSQKEIIEKYLSNFSMTQLQSAKIACEEAIDLYKDINNLGFNVNTKKPTGVPTKKEFDDFKEILDMVLEKDIRHFDKWFLSKKKLLKYTLKKFNYSIEKKDIDAIILYFKREKNDVLEIKNAVTDSDLSKIKFKKIKKFLFFSKYSFNDFNVIIDRDKK
jgi:hypothetical protein